MKYFELVKEFVNSSFAKSGHTNDLKHFERTVYWLKQLKPEADEADMIAAYGHDVERAFKNDAPQIESKKGFKDNYFLEHHPAEGARIIGEFLAKENASKQMLAKIKSLVSKHETGGTKEQDLLKDADSISFFENQVEHFLNNKVKETGKDKVKEKFDWMFNRISSEQAKEIAKPMYEEAIARLKNVVHPDRPHKG